MTREDLLNLLSESPLIASVQASPSSPASSPETLAQLALASKQEGVKLLRLEGEKAIQTIRATTNLPCIGLIKIQYPDSEIYITPTLKEIDILVNLGCEIIALDCTARRRPNNESLQTLIQRIKQNNRLVMADCDTPESVDYAVSLGADLISTTLSGYTAESPAQTDPDFALIQHIAKYPNVIPIAEGRFSTPQQIRIARLCGAKGVVVGGALNDPIKQTRVFGAAAKLPECLGAVDIGGTWMRFGTLEGELARIPTPANPEERLSWIRSQIQQNNIQTLGVSSGGTIHPKTGEVWEAKPIIPGHEGTVFSRETLGVEVYALNDGLAAAWGIANSPEYLNKNIAVLALGTGVGCGAVIGGKLVMGSKGEYPRINDLPFQNSTVEEVLGGLALTTNPSESQKEQAIQAAQFAIQVLESLYQPERIVLTGSVARAPWFKLEHPKIDLSPDEDGLKGALTLALNPWFT